MSNQDQNQELIFSSETLSHFLSSYYQQKKNINRHFSYENWARSLGKINRSLLKQISIGRRKIPPSRVEDFLSYFKFESKAKRHFLELVDLADGGHDKSRLQKKVRDRVAYYKNFQTLRNAEKFLENPDIPILATLFTLEDLPKDVASLARIMNVDDKTITHWIEVLLAMGFIKKTSEGRWKNTKNSFLVPAKLGSEVLINFHKMSLVKAVAGLDKPKEKRNYDALLLPMTQEEYAEYLQMLDDFRADVLEKFNSPTFKGRDLYQVNWAIFSTVQGGPCSV